MVLRQKSCLFHDLQLFYLFFNYFVAIPIEPFFSVQLYNITSILLTYFVGQLSQLKPPVVDLSKFSKGGRHSSEIVKCDLGSRGSPLVSRDPLAVTRWFHSPFNCVSFDIKLQSSKQQLMNTGNMDRNIHF